MSTVDPRALRAEREARAHRSGRNTVTAAVVGIIHLALWALAGYGFVEVGDTFRLMSLNQVGEGWDSQLDLASRYSSLSGYSPAPSLDLFLLHGLAGSLGSLPDWSAPCSPEHWASQSGFSSPRNAGLLPKLSGTNSASLQATRPRIGDFGNGQLIGSHSYCPRSSQESHCLCS